MSVFYHNDLLFENLRFVPFYLPQSRLKPLRDPTVIDFDSISACDEQTDGRADMPMPRCMTVTLAQLSATETGPVSLFCVMEMLDPPH